MTNVTKKNIIDAYNRTSQKINIKSLNHLIKDKKDYVFVNKTTGLVFRDRQTSNSFTADKYSELIFSKKKEFTNFQYGDSPPAVKARHNYVYNTLNDFLDLKKKSLLDVGAGTGSFLELIKNKEKFGVEPQKNNCLLMKKKGIKHHHGTLENLNSKKKFDIVTFLWTLCATYDPNLVIQDALKFTKKNSYILIAESSRVLVHPKKNLTIYLGTKPSYLAPYCFSLNQLKALLMINGFEIVFVNRYFDIDYKVVIGKKTDKKFKNYPGDNHKDVLNFFKLWNEVDKKLA